MRTVNKNPKKKMNYEIPKGTCRKVEQTTTMVSTISGDFFGV